MSMAGVNGLYQFTGIQSAHSVSAPLTLEAKVMGTIANGNPFALYLVSADGRQYLTLNGNLNKGNVGYYGLGLGYTGLGKAAANPERRGISQAVSVNVWSVIRITVDAGGVGAVAVEDLQGSRLAAESNLTVGAGALFVVLAQWEGWPRTQGINEAIWGKVSISTEAENASSISAGPTQAPQAGWFGFANETGHQDREAELRHRCGEFKRVYVPPDAGGTEFTDLCSHGAESCEKVCDWEGRALPCDAVSLGGRRDGSRVALCRLDVGSQAPQLIKSRSRTRRLPRQRNPGTTSKVSIFEISSIAQIA